MDTSELYARYLAGERDFSGLTIEAIDLNIADLEEYVSGVNVLDQANFSNAMFNLTQMECVDFRGANFRGAYLYGVEMRCANLTGADLRSCTIENAAMLAINFTNADLRGSVFNGVIMHGANLTRTNLSGAKLYIGGEDIIWDETVAPNGSIRGRDCSLYD